jgi:TP901 family phage tail tape measure protein
MSRFVLTAQLQLQAPTNVGQIVTQIQNQLNGINVNLQVQGSAQAQRQIQQVTRSCNDATSAAGRMGQAFAVSIRRFAAFSIATRAVGLFTSTLSDAVQTSIDFERQLIKLSQVTGDSVGKLRSLTDTITGLSLKFGVSSQSLLETTTALIQAGISSKDTKVALDALAKSALAPNFDSLSETTEGAIAILAQFKQGVGALEGQLGSINAVAGAFAVEAGDLIDVIRRTGGVFKASGGDLNELLALFTSVRATTRESAESIGTGLRTIFTRIQRPKTIEFLKQFGVELVDLNGKFVGPYEAVRRLSDALSGLGEGDLTFIRIAEELGGFRQIGKVLPLLQQFSTAQAALNVAQNAGNSLTKDAETAQAALAIRITKVKEEFLALVRGITETSTFQIMANTALNLASALIKIADAIKPLLPLLTAMAAINLARGIGSFAGNVVGGLRSGRTFNQGGKVHKFAAGGLVPGVGNRDTVPAMLSPGEFVIRKSSVEKLGASNLAGMNSGGGVRKYAGGGLIDKIASGKKEVGAALLENKGVVPGSFSIVKPQIEKRTGLKLNEKFPILGQFDATREGLSGPTSESFNKALNNAIVGAANEAASSVALDLGLTAKKIDANTQQAFLNSINTGTRGNLFEDTLSVLKGGPFEENPGRPFDFPNGLSGVLKDDYKNLPSSFIDAKASLSAAALTGTGSLQEKTIRQIVDELKNPANLSLYTNGKTMEKGKENFVRGRRYSLSQLGMNKAAAINAGFETRGSTGQYTLRHFGGMIKKFATGGGVGTDTVPALLTPGEFVVNRSSAQSIGYGNLNRMNKVGKYANGGVVQHFAAGTSGTGVSSSGGFGLANINSSIVNLGKSLTILTTQSQGLITVFQRLNQIAAATPLVGGGGGGGGGGSSGGTRSNTQVVQQATQATKQYGLGISLVTSSLQAFIKPLNENSSAMEKFGNSLLTMGTTLGGVIFALEALGVSLTKQSVSKFLSGKGVPKIANQASAKANTMNYDAFLAKGKNVNVKGIGTYDPITQSRATIPSDKRSRRDALRNLVEKRRSYSDFDAATGSPLSRLDRKAARLANPVGRMQARSNFAQSISKAVPLPTSATSGLLKTVGIVSQGLMKLVGPAAAAAAAIGVFNAFVSSFDDSTQRKNTAIKTGDVEGAGKAAQQEAELSNANNARMVAGSAGAAIGGLLGPIGAAVGAALGTGLATVIANVFPNELQAISEMFGGKTMSSIVSLAQAQAQATKTQKAFEQGEKDAISAMEDFNNGTITAAEGLKKIANVTKESVNLQNANQKAITANSANMSKGGSGTARNAISALTFGLVESSAQRNSKIDEENAALAKNNNDTQAKAFEMNKPLMNAAIRESIASSSTPEQAKAKMSLALGDNSPEELRRRAEEVKKEAKTEKDLGNKQSADQLDLNAKQLEQQAEQLEKSFTNLSKEIETNRKAFAAMNLGLSSVNGAANASALKINNFVNSLEAGASPMEGALATLEAGVTGAAQGISDVDFTAALGEASSVLTKFGADAAQVTKFEGNVKAVNSAQKNSAKIFEDVKSSLSETGNQSADARKEAVINSITKNSGLAEGSEEFNNFKKSLEGADIDLEKLANGDISVFEAALKDLGENAIGQAKEALMAQIKINQQLVGLTKQRIDAERNLVEAQKEALQLGMEGREVQAKYGGKAITNEERRGNVVAQANVGAGRLGLSEMKSGSIAELQQRRREITTGFGAAETARRTDNALVGPKGAETAENQKDLAKASKEYVQTVRDLIKAEEDNLKTIEAKTKLEKDSMESLISGDIEKFFQQQAAVGATAAIATGNQSLMGAFGAEALGGAYSNIQRMQEAGVQDVYGQRIGGAGGLGERSAQAALRARGVTDPRAAQAAAGTTAEEEASKSRLRALGGELSQAGQMGVDMAQMELQTATMNLEKATIYATSGVEVVQGREKEAAAAGVAQGKALGGLIYASMGKFIPRGTDTVPAMLTPGEFVVRRDAVNRGNNLALLKAINGGSASADSMVSGFAKGGRVKYLRYGGMTDESGAGGGTGGGSMSAVSLDPTTVNKLSEALNTFNQQLTDSITTLSTTKFKVALDNTNINVNLTGGSFLMSLKDSIQEDLLNKVGEMIKNHKVTEGGNLKDSSGKILSNE